MNGYNSLAIEIPFGGYKKSGIGREGGTGAIEHYSQLKSVFLQMNDIKYPWNEGKPNKLRESGIKKLKKKKISLFTFKKTTRPKKEREALVKAVNWKSLNAN